MTDVGSDVPGGYPEGGFPAGEQDSPGALTFNVNLTDGTSQTVTVDISDFSDLTAEEALLAGVLAGVDGLIVNGEVKPTPQGIAAFIYVKVRRQLKLNTDPLDDFPVFRDQLLGLMEGKTVIAIAHRLSTIARMDRLIVLEQGRIVESGPHDELLRLGGHYEKLWRHQSGGFLADDVFDSDGVEELGDLPR